jgi:7-cyano-7-deazaguanine reductase
MVNPNMDFTQWDFPNKLSKPEGLKSLGSEKTKYVYEGADAKLLETFPNPLVSRHGIVTETAIRLKHETNAEFTSLCPKTGQPDFARIEVVYTPRDLCVESKSWKLYLGSFRQVREFHESCTQLIFDDLFELLNPKALMVTGEFTARGGIYIWPTVSYVAPQ